MITDAERRGGCILLPGERITTCLKPQKLTNPPPQIPFRPERADFWEDLSGSGSTEFIQQFTMPMLSTSTDEPITFCFGQPQQKLVVGSVTLKLTLFVPDSFERRMTIILDDPGPGLFIHKDVFRASVDYRQKMLAISKLNAPVEKFQLYYKVTYPDF